MRAIYTIVFKQNAGLTNPTSRGNKEITVKDEDSADHDMEVTIKSKVTIDPKWVSRGGTVTVTGKGLNAGTATVHLDDPKGRRHRRHRPGIGHCC